MPELAPKIAELEARLDRLVRTQIDFQTEVSTIRLELSRLRGPEPGKPLRADLPPQWSASPPPSQQPPVEAAQYKPPTEKATKTAHANQTPPPRPDTARTQEPEATRDDSFSGFMSSYADSARADLEKFIGENLISKIGIVILVLGVGIGAKYAIDSGWISPTMRIVFGYVMGLGLIGFAARLKAKYLNFSAVLFSGGMSIMYFVTYFAYTSYSLIGQGTAFGLMVLFTAVAVTAAILYNRQIIAHIGLVGAYAVPFLLSENTGNYLFLFAYMAIINAGILSISARKYWKPLFYTSSVFTWLIFGGWFISDYAPTEHFYLALTFLAIFFATFYATKIIHGVLRPESEDPENLISLLITGFIFYSFCFAISDVRAGAREYAAIFSFLAVMSLAILLTSFRFYGRVLVYLSYPFTWLIFGAWLLTKYRADEHFVLAAVFAGIFFAIFYGATIVYRLITNDLGLIEISGLVLTNSFIFYGFGYAILDSREDLRGYGGVFTVAHAALHSLVAQTVGWSRPSAVDVVQVLTVLILTFATIAIPVQFDGSLVTLIWSVEAAIMFWFGRTRIIALFEYFSYPLMALATVSLAIDWINAYAARSGNADETTLRPLANGDFITALVFVAAFAFIYVVNRDDRYQAAIDRDSVRPFGYAVASVALFALYNTFRTEIGNYHHFQMADLTRLGSADGVTGDISRFNVLWQLNYTIFFLIAMSAVNLQKIRSSILAVANTGFGVLSLAIFLTIGMQLFYELRLSYAMPGNGEFSLPMNIAIRYISYAFVAGLHYTFFRYTRGDLLTSSITAVQQKIAFDAILHGTILITASCELVNLMAQFNIPDSTKLGLSILWGVYALFLIVIGIANNKKYLRIAAIVLLGITLGKLFLYDIAELDTIPKTILFVSLGLLMLIVSFLYAKYKALIFPPSGTGNDGDQRPDSSA